jgi:hypothetical protein
MRGCRWDDLIETESIFRKRDGPVSRPMAPKPFRFYFVTTIFRQSLWRQIVKQNDKFSNTSIRIIGSFINEGIISTTNASLFLSVVIRMTLRTNLYNSFW